MAQSAKKSLLFNSRKVQIDSILNRAAALHTYKERVRWFRSLFTWLRTFSPSLLPENLSQASVPSLRIKYLLQLLQRNPEWEKNFAAAFAEALRDVSSLELFSEIGVDRDVSFLAEVGERLSRKFLIEGGPQKSLGALLETIFPSDEDYVWVESIDSETLAQLIRLITRDPGVDWSGLRIDVENAILVLTTQLCALGLRPALRARLSEKDFRQSPYYDLSEKAREFLRAVTAGEDISQKRDALILQLADARAHVNQAYAHLDQHGVSIGLVYALEHMLRLIARIELLVELRRSPQISPRLLQIFISQLIQDLHASHDLWDFVWSHAQLLLKKVVQRNSEIGEHYIAATPREYFGMLKKAGGGGFIMGFTVYFKFLLMAVPLSAFAFGFLASLNYAVSFVVIQVLHLTVGTKQPASTAPVLAAKIKEASTQAEVESAVDDLVCIARSQFASVLGNMALVAPTVMAICWIFFAATGQPFLNAHEAEHALQSVDLIGGSWLYAIVTGGLLFLSSLIAGWADNWFAFNKMRERIIHNEKINSALDQKRAIRWALVLEKNIAGLAGNISLGFFLGLMPVIFKFIGLPLDVRHVTLSTGQIFATVIGAPAEWMASPEFLRALLGCVVIGILNVTSSFFFALSFAAAATDVRHSRRTVFKRFLIRALKRPWSLFLPVRSRPLYVTSPEAPSRSDAHKP